MSTVATEEELAEALRVGDYAFVAQHLRARGEYECIAEHVERTKHPRKGWKDPEKEKRDLKKATFKAIMNFFEDERGLHRDDAYYRALEEYPEIGGAAERMVQGKDGPISRLAETLTHCDHVERLRRGYIAPGAISKRRA